ncbi:MAG: thiamine pyrophosphate-dependent enzyme, partial [Planctomycetota bacterium]
YMETYGFHTIHGRAPAVATGAKLANPDLDVWLVTGDGDGLSIGGNHLIHTLRRNVGIKILLFNNRIYGLTKGQYSPTSEMGKQTKSTPMGSLDQPFSPLQLALGAGATWVGRSIDIMIPHLVSMVEKLDAHQGTGLLEIYQNCNIFNDGAFKSFTDKPVRDDRVVEVEHGKPLLFGKDKDKAVGFNDDLMPIVREGVSEDEDSLWHWNAKAPNPARAMAIAAADEATIPVPVGVFRDVERPVYETETVSQVRKAQENKVESLEELINGRETWTVGG